jgi:hypothetical protein
VRCHAGERGAVLATLLISTITLLMLVMAATTVMTGRNTLLQRSIQGTRALLAASAAIEEATQRAQEGTLVTGTVVSGMLAEGMLYQYRAVYLASDGKDNDGDGLVDEGDERSYEVVALGSFGSERRRVSAIVIEPATVGRFGAAILTLGTPRITTDGGASVSGLDTMINGTRGPVANDVMGIATQPPHTGSELLANYTQNGSEAVYGVGPTPSIGATTTDYNLPGLLTIARNSAQNVVEPGTQTSLRLGDARRGDFQISYCPGDLALSGSNVGAGLLLVSGTFSNTGNFRWDGIVVVLGNVDIAGTTLITGALIQGPEGQTVTVSGSSTVRYSVEALSQISRILPQIYYVEGWRERAL